MGARFKFSDAVKKEVGTSDFIPYSSHVTKNAIKLDNGDYIQTIRLQGAAHESADAIHINAWHDQLNGLMRNIASPKLAVWSHIVRREVSEFPAGEFELGFCHDFNEKYRRYVAAEKMLTNELYLTLVYRPKGIKINSWFNDLFRKTTIELEQQQHEEIEQFSDIVSTAMASLVRYDPELLTCYEYKNHTYSEVLEFLAFLIDGEWKRFPLPRSEIRNVLATSRPFFGKSGLMSLKGPINTQYCGIIAIQEYPAITCPGILNDLLSMPFEFVLSQSFTFLSKPVAVNRMKQQQGRMINAGDVATSQVDGISTALDELISNRFVMGAHSLSLLVRANDHKTLNDCISDAGSVLAENGMKWSREDTGMAGAFWAQLPGNFRYRIRVGDITSRNFAGFSSFHNYPVGHIRHNQWGDAVTMFRTTSGAPYYFSFHKSEEGTENKRLAKLDPNHKDLANTVIIGKAGSGKTVLEMILLAQVQKFHQPSKGKLLTCVVFDKDLGASIGVRAMGGRYYPLKNGLPSGFNPFQMDPTPSNMSFLTKLIRQLVKHESFPITPRQEREINEAVIGVMQVDNKSKRRISSVLEFFNPTEENGLHTRLSRWCGHNEFGWLFDNDSDTMRLDECTMVGFDVTEFLENPITRTPTIMYLFHRIESLIDGRRIPIFMDEFPRLLDDPAFQDLAEKKLVTIRKQDGFLVLLCQDPRQVLKNPIAYAIVSQTASKFFLPNPSADHDDYVNGFKLTEREFEIVRSLPEKSRRFLLKQGDNSVVAELNLRGFEDELAVFSGNTATSLMVEKLVAELGNDPTVWLPEFHRIRKTNPIEGSL